jgi:hypothetical protein
VVAELSGKPIAMPACPVHCGFELYDEPVRGFSRRARMGINGVLLFNGTAQVLVSMGELWKLAESLEPALAPPISSAAIAHEIGPIRRQPPRPLRNPRL